MLVLGLMSGTSLDGLDMALCEFDWLNNTYTYKVLKAQTVVYSRQWKQRLAASKDGSAQNYFENDARYARYVAAQINEFLSATSFKPDIIASHGHTIFHQPKLGFTTQIGSGAVIAAETGLTTVCDFRILDVALGGQGAPLVPFGDKHLFGSYAACLNIGGIANISLEDESGKRIAYDICEANMLLNYLAETNDLAFDAGGQLARSGKADKDLLAKLNALPYYSHAGAKSLGREWFEAQVLPFFKDGMPHLNDALATATEHVANVIANDLEKYALKNVLVTGGGAFNEFLIERIKAQTRCEIIIPEPLIVNFKEALIFAFLGYLRIRQQANTLATVTGAKKDSIGGAVYLGG